MNGAMEATTQIHGGVFHSLLLGIIYYFFGWNILDQMGFFKEIRQICIKLSRKKNEIFTKNSR